MKIEQQQNRRLAVFFFYDGDGIADRYVDYLLQKVMECHERLIVVSNGPITEETRALFQKYTQEIIERENKGLDVYAYQAAFHHAGWNDLEQYDEVTIFNHTLMGPVCSLVPVYEKMAKRDIDFWGISKHEKFVPEDENGNSKKKKSILEGFPEHIQSHYMVYRKSLVCSQEFQNFWNNLPPIKGYEDSVRFFESVFTKKFEEYGFKWDICSDQSRFKRISMNPIVEYPVEMIRDCGLPFFKRRSFFQDQGVAINVALGDASARLYRYLKNQTNYDLSLIWDNILRSVNHMDFVTSLNLHYIIPNDYVVSRDIDHNIKVAAVFVCREIDEYPQIMYYINKISNRVDIIIGSTTVNINIFKKTLLESNTQINYVDITELNDGQVFWKMLSLVEKYSYFCYLQDINGKIAAKEIARKNAESLVASTEYIDNVINLFEKNPKLGVLAPLEPIHGSYYTLNKNRWGTYHIELQNILAQIHGSAPTDSRKDIVYFPTMSGWFRTDALCLEEQEKSMLIKRSESSDFIELIKRLIAFISIHNQYYPAYIISDSMAQTELTDYRYFNSEFLKMTSRIGVNNDDTYRFLLHQVEKKARGIGLIILEKLVMPLASRIQHVIPSGLYDRLIHIKRKLFGPYDLD